MIPDLSTRLVRELRDVARWIDATHVAGYFPEGKVYVLYDSEGNGYATIPAHLMRQMAAHYLNHSQQDE